MSSRFRPSSTGGHLSALSSAPDASAAGLRLPGLADEHRADRVGAKFSSLARAAADSVVPAAFAVETDVFQEALSDSAVELIRERLTDIRATVGAYWEESAAGIARIVADVRLTGEARRLLNARMAEVFPGDVAVAVRSSGVTEDGAASSLAGVYDSFLGVRGPDAVAAAIEACWRSYYSAAAIAARVRAGDFDPAPRLAVIVQQYIEPLLAGVAFCGLDGDSDRIDVEYVQGPADGLVAGLVSPSRANSAALALTPPEHRATITRVVETTRALRTARGHDVDVEWAADTDAVHVVQVRPVTARRSSRSASTLWIRRLYVEDPPADADLGNVAAVYAGFVAKRGPANRLAAQQGVAVTTGWIIGFTGRALSTREGRQRVDDALATGASTDCLLDLADSLRQLIMPKSELVDFLLNTIGGGAGSDVNQAVVVRDYVFGDLGMVTTYGDDGLVAEYSADGLMALNRGTAKVVRVPFSPHDVDRGGTATPLQPHLPTIIEFAEAMRKRYGAVALEWVLDGDRLVFLDYSMLGPHESAATRVGIGTVISAGSASGPLLTIADREFLERLSNGPAISVGAIGRVEHPELAELVRRVRQSGAPPIVRVSRPYAVLSVLIGSVAGFVFEHGSVLTHLAILLREAGVPAICASTLGAESDGRAATIDQGVFRVA